MFELTKELLDKIGSTILQGPCPALVGPHLDAACTSCTGSCKNSCRDTCKGSCKNGCTRSCKGHSR